MHLFDFNFKGLLRAVSGPNLTGGDLHARRWKIELFFKGIKQHLRIKAFYGISENAVKPQIWIAIAVYVLIAIIRKQSHLTQSSYAILQISSITLFEKMPILQAFFQPPPMGKPLNVTNQHMADFVLDCL